MGQNLSIKDFQTEINGRRTDLFFIENENGTRAAITNYGARIVAIWVRDSKGDYDNVVACYDSIREYLEHDEIYLGAVVGRYANRIKGAHFKLDDEEYVLSANDGKNQLHGGFHGFHNQVWKADQQVLSSIELSLYSADGAEGFPGNMNVNVIYSLSDDDELIIEYKAESDKDTIINLTNHSYFNLGGESTKFNAHNHCLSIDADHYLPVYTDLVPIGEIAKVQDTPFDFRKQQLIRNKFNNNHPQLKRGARYDHCFVLNKDEEGSYRSAAQLVEKDTGRKLEVKTTEPGLQFFECEFNEELRLNMDSGVCLETQHFPDSQNHPSFPSTVLRAGEQFYSQTAYCFSVIRQDLL